ncbi:MAG: DUF6266 family protein [Flavobacteriaceae bacterium]
MARFKNKGKAKSLSGLIGNVVLVDGDVVRSKPQKSNHKPTKNEKNNQSKFAIVNAFIEPFYDFMKHRFKDLFDKKNARDAIRSYHQLYLTTEDNGVHTINYPKALMSSGRLRGLHAAGVSLDGRILALVWQDNSEQALAATTDMLSVAAYNATEGEAYFFEDCATRGDGQALLTFPDYFPTDEVHLWATFEDENNLDCSNSEYLGLLEGV